MIPLGWSYVRLGCQGQNSRVSRLQGETVAAMNAYFYGTNLEGMLAYSRHRIAILPQQYKCIIIGSCVLMGTTVPNLAVTVA